MQKEEKNNDEYIKVEIYEYNGKTIRLDLYIKEEKKLQLEYIDKNGTKKLNINQLYYELKDKYDTLYKNANIESTNKTNKWILALLAILLLINIISVIKLF